ncbi:bestrophin family ion channel [Psychrobacter sanguinis]|uniref:bestrophin family protein n=1 Tax=Psychrobacter sanguinis TaxID=861445 RepID=UPI002A7501AF|nr:bestrophin family ion channel [Psychrobacter sanguinis]MDY3307209.1 bestrophin family ion channel [Psychrobacter sanguinis]
MIVLQKPNAFKILFTLRGSIIPHIYRQVLFIILMSTIISAVQHWIPSSFSSYSAAPLTLLGIALSLFLGFRNNASYQRWWEARILWGQLVYESRSFTRQVMSFVDDKAESGLEVQRTMVNLAIAFTHALRHRLRNTSPWQDVDKFIPPEHYVSARQAGNLPEYILRLLGQQLKQCRQKNLTSDLMIQNMDERLTSLTVVLSACERIHNTPLPLAYTLLVHRTTYLYCFMLPFGLATSLGWVTPLVCGVIAYTFFGLDALNEEIADPFGEAANHLPLTTLSRMIERNLLEALGETDLPTEIVPENGYLP